jgi:hypothetical protein
MARKTRLAWGGFCGGKLESWCAIDTSDQLAVFKTRKEGRRRFEDVRRIEIREVKRRNQRS